MHVMILRRFYKMGRTMRAACSAINTGNNVYEIFTLAITRNEKKVNQINNDVRKLFDQYRIHGINLINNKTNIKKLYT